MAKRSSDEWSSDRVKVIEDIEEEVEYPQTVQVVLLRNKRIIVRGKVTGQEYVFNGAGSSVFVDIEDAPDLLSKRPGTSCCGGSLPSPIFVLA